jgi:addiction module HigA family antidote
MPPVHPGEILLEEFLRPLNMSQYALARAIGVPPRRINEIVHGIRSVTPDTALRLSRYFNLSNTFWLDLQTRYDIDITMDKLGDALEREVTPLKRAG